MCVCVGNCMYVAFHINDSATQSPGLTQPPSLSCVILPFFRPHGASANPQYLLCGLLQKPVCPQRHPRPPAGLLSPTHPPSAPSLPGASVRQQLSTYRVTSDVSAAPPGLSRLPLQPFPPTSSLRKLRLGVAHTLIAAGLFPQRWHPAPSSPAGSSVQGVRVRRRLLMSAVSAAATLPLPSAVLTAPPAPQPRCLFLSESQPDTGPL